MNDDSDKPTILSISDIDKMCDSLNNSEIKSHQCRKCSKEYIHDSYGHHIGECDECWFSRFPKEEVKAFFRSFFE
jgi:ribosomal protein L37AE/L43A